jgi:tripartite-type tricarboxylate transporter receptor subunit TctC
MLGSTGTQTMAPHLARRLGFDPLASFAAVSLVGSTPNALAVRTNLPAQDLEELIELAKRRPGFLTYASSGNGTTLHLAGVLFARMADVELVHVSYKGNAPALNDVVAGRVDMIFSPLPPLLPFLRAGRVRVLGIAATDRLASAPEIPTLAEQGLPGYESGTWYGVFARAGTPQPVVDALSADIRASLQDRKVREALLAQGVEPKASAPQQLDTLVRSDYARWGKVIKDAGVKPD